MRTIPFKARPVKMALAFNGAAEPDGRSMIAIGFGDTPSDLEFIGLEPRMARELFALLGSALDAEPPHVPS